MIIKTILDLIPYPYEIHKHEYRINKPHVRNTKWFCFNTAPKRIINLYIHDNVPLTELYVVDLNDPECIMNFLKWIG